MPPDLLYTAMVAHQTSPPVLSFPGISSARGYYQQNRPLLSLLLNIDNLTHCEILGNRDECRWPVVLFETRWCARFTTHKSPLKVLLTSKYPIYGLETCLRKETAAKASSIKEQDSTPC